MRSKAQIAYEYLVLIFFFTALFTVFLMLTAAGEEDLGWQLDEAYVQDFAIGLQDELYITAMQPTGFKRNITLPGTLNGKPYELSFHAETTGNHYLSINCSGHYADKELPALTLPTATYVAGRELRVSNQGATISIT